MELLLSTAYLHKLKYRFLHGLREFFKHSFGKVQNNWIPPESYRIPWRVATEFREKFRRNFERKYDGIPREITTEFREKLQRNSERNSGGIPFRGIQLNTPGYYIASLDTSLYYLGRSLIISRPGFSELHTTGLPGSF